MDFSPKASVTMTLSSPEADRPSPLDVFRSLPPQGRGWQSNKAAVDSHCALLDTFSLSGDVPDFEFARSVLSAVQIWTRAMQDQHQWEDNEKRDATATMMAMAVVIGPVVAVLGARPQAGDHANRVRSWSRSPLLPAALDRFAIISIPPDLLAQSASALNARLLETEQDIHRACQCLMDLVGSDNAVLR